MRIHAWSRHLDRARPIEVVVAQREDELLELQLGQAGLVDGHVEVRGLLATLSSAHREQEEVKLASTVVSGGLNELRIDEATAWRVLETPAWTLHKEGLHNALVDDYEGDTRPGSCLVINGFACLLELANLRVDNLLTFTSTYTISEDDNIGWVLTAMSSSKGVDSALETLLQLSINDLLALLLHDEVREVLRHILVFRCCETDDRLAAGMANIDTDEHCALIGHLVGEFHFE